MFSAIKERIKNKDLESKNLKLLSEIARLESESAIWRNTNDAARRELKAAKKHICDLNEEIDKQNEEIERLRKYRYNARRSIRDLHRALESRHKRQLEHRYNLKIAEECELRKENYELRKLLPEDVAKQVPITTTREAIHNVTFFDVDLRSIITNPELLEILNLILQDGEQRSKTRCEFYKCKEEKEIMSTVADIKEDLIAGKVAAERAIGKLDILTEKILLLKQKVGDGRGATFDEVNELAALAQGMRDVLEQVGVEVEEAAVAAEDAPTEKAPAEEASADESNES